MSAAGWLFVIQRLFRSPKIRVLSHNLILHTLNFVVFWFLSLYRYFVNAVQPSEMMTQRPTWRVIFATAARASCALIDSTSDIDITMTSNSSMFNKCLNSAKSTCVEYSVSPRTFNSCSKINVLPSSSCRKH